MIRLIAMSSRWRGPYTVKYRSATTLVTTSGRLPYIRPSCSVAHFVAPYGDSGVGSEDSELGPPLAPPYTLEEDDTTTRRTPARAAASSSRCAASTLLAV